jgi:hypothetical protein
MATYFSRSCPRCTQRLTVEVAQPVSNGRIRSVSGYCTSCGHRFDWLLIRGKTFWKAPINCRLRLTVPLELGGQHHATSPPLQ